MREKIKYEAVRSIKMKVGGFTGTDDYYIQPGEQISSKAHMQKDHRKFAARMYSLKRAQPKSCAIIYQQFA